MNPSENKDNFSSQIPEEQTVTVNVEQIMQEIRAQALSQYCTEQVHAFSPPEFCQNDYSQAYNPADWGQFINNLQFINFNYNIPYYWDLGTPGLKRFVKRVVRKLAKFLIMPILERQIDFNEHAVLCMNSARFYIEEQKHENEKLYSEIQKLRNEISLKSSNV